MKTTNKIQSGKTPPKQSMSRRRWLGLALGGLAVGGGAFAIWRNNQPQAADPVQHRRYTYEIVHEYPHDPQAFTQGLVYHNGFLYEGTGQYGRSNLRKVELETGRVVQQSEVLPNAYFGEGIVLWDDRIFQLTWENHIAFVYDLNTLERIDERRYPRDIEGWGLTHNGQHLIMSDGTSNLYFIDPDTFREEHQIVVRDGFLPVDDLNELEYIDGQIYANVWHEDYILRIDPDTGEVISRLELTGLRPRSTMHDSEQVLNGIAYDPAGPRLFVTGKMWPKLFEIRQVAV